MEYNGYDLFEDLEDTELQTRNRAVVLWNIYESNTRNGLTKPGGVADMIGYVRSLPTGEQSAVITKLSTFIEQGGIA